MCDNAYYIKNSVNMAKIINMYGFKPNRAGFISCPFHSEKTASLRIYPNSFYCFGCGTGGDVIKFVSLMEQCDFTKACECIDNMFNLNLYEKPTLSQHRKNQKKLAEIKEKQQLEEKKKQYEKYAYRCIAAFRSWLRKQPQTENILHDYDYLERLIYQFIQKENIAEYDIKALLTALMTKYRKGDNNSINR